MNTKALVEMTLAESVPDSVLGKVSGHYMSVAGPVIGSIF